MQPNIKYLPGAYRGFYDHHLALTELALAEAMKKCGLRAEKVILRFLPCTMSDNKRYPIRTLRLYLAGPVVWLVFGKLFLVIARKPH